MYYIYSTARLKIDFPVANMFDFCVNVVQINLAQEMFNLSTRVKYSAS